MEAARRMPEFFVYCGGAHLTAHSTRVVQECCDCLLSYRDVSILSSWYCMAFYLQLIGTSSSLYIPPLLPPFPFIFPMPIPFSSCATLLSLSASRLLRSSFCADKSRRFCSSMSFSRVHFSM